MDNPVELGFPQLLGINKEKTFLLCQIIKKNKLGRSVPARYFEKITIKIYIDKKN